MTSQPADLSYREPLPSDRTRGESRLWRSWRLASRVPRSTIALLAISIILPLVLFALAAVENRRDVRHAAELRVERTTRILHEHAMKVFETHQLLIDQLNARLRTMDWSDLRKVGALHNMLAHLQALLPQVAAINVTDATGRLRVSSRVYPPDAEITFADRDYFKVLRAHDQEMPYISRSLIGRLSGEPVFTMAARVVGPTPGVFDGVLSIAVDENYFVDFYRDTEREYRHIVILARENGGILASEPADGLAILPPDVLFHSGLRRPGKGPRIGPSVFDGNELIFGYDKVGAYPVMIGFGITWASALQPWWRNMWGYGLVAVLSSLTLLGVSGFAIRRIALEGRATLRWRRSAALLEREMVERAGVEEQLRQAQKMEAVGRLTGGIAHDFNNLLTVVIGSLDLLSRRMKDADPRQQALVRNAVDGASRAATLTARLLAFSREHPLDPETIDVNGLITGMANLLQRTLGEPVTIDYALADGLWLGFADPNQLENAILNLCVNAVDAMPKGGMLTIESANAMLDAAFCDGRSGLAAGAYIRISVSDTGTGMAPEVVARAFEPFYTTKPVGKGTGLGLSQVYGFARQSGGHAAIESELGVGTTVRIFVPQSKAEQGVADDAVPIAARARQPDWSPRGATVLIVEDDDLVRRFSAGALRDNGVLVLEASSGSEGLARLAEHPEVAILFTDVVLKGPLNGRELADRARAMRPDLPVLMTSGYTKDAIVETGRRFDAGFDFIAKPFTPAALSARIVDLLRAVPIEERSSAVPSEERSSAVG